MQDADIEKHRAEFEADAGPLGFDLTRDHACQKITPEPWAEYRDDTTGNRWAGWLAARSSHPQAQEALTVASTLDFMVDDLNVFTTARPLTPTLRKAGALLRSMAGAPAAKEPANLMQTARDVIAEHRDTLERLHGACIYPRCNCPFDAPADPNWCARGLPHACRKCGGEMKSGQAIQQTYTGSSDLGGPAVTMSPGGSGRLVSCLKCEKCGWSVSAGLDGGK